MTAFYKPSFAQGKTSRISSKSATIYTRKQEQYFIQGDCPECGAKNNDIQKWYDGEQDENKLTHEQKIEKMKRSGTPTQIVQEIKRN